MYADVVQLAESYCLRTDARKSYTYTFDGVLPTSARTAVAAAIESKQYEDFFLLVDCFDPHEPFDPPRLIHAVQRTLRRFDHHRPVILHIDDDVITRIDMIADPGHLAGLELVILD